MIRAEVEALWDSGRILSARLTQAPLFSLSLRLRRPTAQALSERYDAVRRWMRALEEGSKAERGFGYDIEWIDINHRVLGRNRVPARVCFSGEADALRLIGKQRQADRFSEIAKANSVQFPALRDWFVRRPLRALSLADEWSAIAAVLAWFRDHPRSGLHLRQLDIAGVDTKFIEARKGLLTELLDAILPPGAIEARFAGAANFELRYGLKVRPARIRFRVLDAAQRIRGATDLAIPAEEFARLDLDVARVFITENEINGLAFPDCASAIVIFGLGHALGLLADAAWLRTRDIVYWGDIDTHGFVMLDRLRALFPHATSLLMDRATLLANRDLWVTEQQPFDGPLHRLGPAEAALFEQLRRNDLGTNVRLEQERIPFGQVRRGLAAFGCVG